MARKIWDYHHLNQELEKADCILVLGSHDLRVAEYAAKLFLDGWAPILIFSGGLGYLTQGIWNEPEAQKFAKKAIEIGVPRDKILIEDKSTNTGDNILFSKKLIEEKHMNPRKIILVQKPYMERRTYATFKKLWPDKECVVTSPPIGFEEDIYGKNTGDADIHALVGDLQRIKEYPSRGFQIPQEIPSDVWQSYEELVKLGYTEHLIK